MENINYNYILLYETAKAIAEKYGRDIRSMEDWEVGEMLDLFIDEALFRED